MIARVQSGAMLYLGLRLVHILFMTTWIGSALFATADVKRTFATGEPSHLPLLRERMRKTGIAAGVSGLVTVLTGIALIFVLGGFGKVPIAIHIGLTTGVLALVVGAGGIGGTWRKIDTAIGSGAPMASLQPLVGRLAMLGGIFHLLLFSTLVLMVLRTAIG
jgi:hypothetical protein